MNPVIATGTIALVVMVLYIWIKFYMPGIIFMARTPYHYRRGDVWESPTGKRYRITGVLYDGGYGHCAYGVYGREIRSKK